MKENTEPAMLSSNLNLEKKLLGGLIVRNSLICFAKIIRGHCPPSSNLNLEKKLLGGLIARNSLICFAKIIRGHCPLKTFFLTILILAGAVIPARAPASPKECTCHSKNPAMVRMHDLLAGRDCGDCHDKKENLMSPSSPKESEERSQALARRFEKDPFCLPCHNTDGSFNEGESDAMAVSRTLYCPQDRLKLPAGAPACPKCGGELLDVDELMEQAKQNPSNRICRACHLDEEVRGIKGHEASPGDCLACHEGHNDCAACHR